MGALKVIRQAKRHTKKIQIIGDCKILTAAMTDGSPVNDPYLEELVQEIRKECAFFEEIEFHHVSRKYNKRADQLATAARQSQRGLVTWR
jgi:ribonuclease HI